MVILSLASLVLILELVEYNLSKMAREVKLRYFLFLDKFFGLLKR